MSTSSRLDWGVAPALDAFEALMWRMDVYPHLRSAVVGIELLDRVPDRERVIAAHRWGAQAVPRLRDRLVDVPLATPEWVEDTGFDLASHLEFVRLPAPGSERQLLDHAAAFAMAPFDRKRPPWQAQVIEGLEGGRAAYILKLHHALSDGIGIVQLMSFMHSRSPEPGSRRASAATVAAAPGGEPSPVDIWRRRLRRELDAAPGRARALLSKASRALASSDDGETRLSRAARYLASARRALAPYMAPPSPLLKDRSHQWRFEVLDLPLTPFKAAAKACKATLNDAFVAGLLGGFARYHTEMGVEVDEIPIGMPINVRSEHAAGGGNHFAPGQLAGRLAGATPIERMRHIGEQVARLREEPALAAPLALMPLLVRLPQGLVAQAMGPKMAANDLQISNVPGIRDAVYLAGARVTRLYPFAPLPGVAGMIALVSHGEHCCIGLNLDARAIAEPDRLMRALRVSFDEVLALAPAAATHS
ncbi:wax ester/triacylglycerol synthase domain-containing protein [Nevskia sp.]|uniref:wax ester/triacylglycerol synthase domain-containing protein n=1 Tax=Nevskia sp. TaxID=1929292 RepID=UPI0025F8BB59|nr:wax ester/triacylglycerol synthase domain-containing protein [Nevskia sp.]